MIQNIKSYLDYQQYLRDFYQDMKKAKPFFSYRYFGNHIGLDAGFLVKVLQGKMHLALKSVPRITEHLRFNEKEAEYFEVLVRYGRATANSEIKFYFEKLLSLKDMDVNAVAAGQYEFYQKWYYSAIRELIGFFEVSDNFPALASQLNPPISTKEAKHAIALLEKLELIYKDESGRYRQASRFITTDEKWKSAAVHSFQQETIRLAGEALDRHPKEVRDISTLTLSVSYRDFDEIRERINDFRRSLLQMTNENKADCVYQINVQAIPLSKIEENT